MKQKKIVLTLLCIASLLLTAALLAAIPGSVGQPGVRAAQGGDSRVLNAYESYAANAVSDALDGVISIPKHYWIGDGALKAPVPLESCYGETDNPADLIPVLERAQTLLRGQSLYFSPDVEILSGSTVRYYLDDTIFAVSWKTVMDYTVYSFAEIKIADPSQFRRFLAGGEYGSEKLYITTEMADSVNAVVASSGDYYLHRSVGVVVSDGIVRKMAGDRADTCFVDADGNLSLLHRGELADMEEAQAYVTAHNIRFSLAFGPILVENGVASTPANYPLGEVNDHYARAALCQRDELHYLLAVANSEGAWRQVPTIHEFARRIQETGCPTAYALDGGQTAAIVMHRELVNRVVFGYQRRISDIIYFATAIPDGE